VICFFHPKHWVQAGECSAVIQGVLVYYSRTGVAVLLASVNAVFVQMCSGAIDAIALSELELRGM
jgi:hypothetical protein